METARNNVILISRHHRRHRKNHPSGVEDEYLNEYHNVEAYHDVKQEFSEIKNALNHLIMHISKMVAADTLVAAYREGGFKMNDQQFHELMGAIKGVGRNIEALNERVGKLEKSVAVLEETKNKVHSLPDENAVKVIVHEAIKELPTKDHVHKVAWFGVLANVFLIIGGLAALLKLFGK